MIDTIICGDCLEVMPTIEDKLVDMVLCDLPYGVTASKWDAQISLEALWKQFKRLLNPLRIVVFTSTQPYTTTIINSNPDWFKYEWIWIKHHSSLFVHAKNRPMSIHENVLVFSDGAMNHKSITQRRMPYNPQGLEECDIIENGQKWKASKFGGVFGSRPSHTNETRRKYKNYPTTELPHFNLAHSSRNNPTQKPVALFEYLIRTYTNENDLVLDPTAGSGTTAVACRRSNRHYICIEKEPEYCAIAEKRIAEML